jgi:aminocarboxymuconate-semialdehyde decarboxylase
VFIDIYTHIFPGGFFERMSKAAPRLENIGKRMQSVKMVHDLDLRFRLMDQFGDYGQVISLPNPPLEDITEPDVGAELARVANDAMAELCRKHPARFPAFVAALAMHDMDASMDELHRAIRDLGARGVQIFTNIAGEPLDLPKFQPVFDAMAGYDLPIWMHPARGADMPDYKSETRSRYEMWWCFGWPYETSVAMARLVFSGLFDRHPDIKIVTHHMGGMIPYFDGRIGPGMDVLGGRTTDEDYSEVLSSLERPQLDYFKMFYADTAMFGTHIGIECGLKFFDIDHVVFSTDCPFAPVKETLEAIDRLELEEADKKKLLGGNAARLMKLEAD